MLKSSNHTLLFSSLLLLLLFGLLAVVLQTELVGSFDSSIISAVYQLRSPFLTEIMQLFTYIGDTVRVIIFSLILMAVLYFLYRQRQEVILFFVVLAGTGIFNALLKVYFQRERPTLDRLIFADGFSFPSGHSMAALSLYSIITFLFWKHIPHQFGRAALLIATSFIICCIGFSRVYLGVHYPSDIIGAFLFSGSWILFTIWGFTNYQGQPAKHIPKSETKKSRMA